MSCAQNKADIVKPEVKNPLQKWAVSCENAGATFEEKKFSCSCPNANEIFLGGRISSCVSKEDVSKRCSKKDGEYLCSFSYDNFFSFLRMEESIIDAESIEKLNFSNLKTPLIDTKFGDVRSLSFVISPKIPSYSVSQLNNLLPSKLEQRKTRSKDIIGEFRPIVFNMTDFDFIYSYMIDGLPSVMSSKEYALLYAAYQEGDEYSLLYTVHSLKSLELENKYKNRSIVGETCNDECIIVEEVDLDIPIAILNFDKLPKEFFKGLKVFSKKHIRDGQWISEEISLKRPNLEITFLKTPTGDLVEAFVKKEQKLYLVGPEGYLVEALDQKAE
jgi:hypothetical protein